MKVGDLVRLRIGHRSYDKCALDFKHYSSQLAVIIRHNEAACNPWKVKVINDREIWLKSYELEKL
jgi:hypothetical protein